MSDKLSILLFFPVEAHVYKFLQQKCGEKLVASKHDLYGSVVLDILNKSYSTLRSFPSDLTFPVEVSLRYMEDYGIFIDKNVIRKFNNRMDKMFREEMRTYVSLSNQANNIEKNTALRQFILCYNITEDDIKFETLLKDIVRNT